MKSKKIIILLSVLLLVIVISLLSKSSPEKRLETQPIIVRTVQLTADLPVRKVKISGTTQSAETSVIRFQVGGRVTDKMIRLGDSISEGDAIANLYNPELEPITVTAKDNLARLATQVAQAERDFTRIDALYNDQAVTLAEWENVRTALTANKNAQSAAESELARATQVADELNLVAPFPGSVTQIMIDVGDVVAAGTAAVRLSNPNMVELKLAISDDIAEQIELGQIVSVQRSLKPLELPMQGIVSEISPYRERGSLPEIIISLDSAEIGPGVAVDASIEIVAKQGINIPTRSVIMTGENTVAVYRVVNEIATLVPIRPLRLDTDMVLIEEGLAPGDSLVIEGISQLYDGASIVEAKVSTNLEINKTGETL